MMYGSLGLGFVQLLIIYLPITLTTTTKEEYSTTALQIPSRHPEAKSCSHNVIKTHSHGNISLELDQESELVMCEWHFKDFDRHVKLEFLNLNIPHSTDGLCIHGYVMYGDFDYKGRKVIEEKVCGDELPDTFISKTSVAWLTYFMTGPSSSVSSEQKPHSILIRYSPYTSGHVENQLYVAVACGLVIPLSCIIPFVLFILKLRKEEDREKHEDDTVRRLQRKEELQRMLVPIIRNTIVTWPKKPLSNDEVYPEDREDCKHACKRFRLELPKRPSSSAMPDNKHNPQRNTTEKSMQFSQAHYAEIPIFDDTVCAAQGEIAQTGTTGEVTREQQTVNVAADLVPEQRVKRQRNEDNLYQPLITKSALGLGRRTPGKDRLSGESVVGNLTQHNLSCSTPNAGEGIDQSLQIYARVAQVPKDKNNNCSTIGQVSFSSPGSSGNSVAGVEKSDPRNLQKQPLESICELLDEYSDSKESTQSMQTLQGSNRSTPLNQSPVRFNANKTTLIKQAVKRYTGGSTIVDESSASNIHKYKGSECRDDLLASSASTAASVPVLTQPMTVTSSTGDSSTVSGQSLPKRVTKGQDPWKKLKGSKPKKPKRTLQSLKSSDSSPNSSVSDPTQNQSTSDNSEDNVDWSFEDARHLSLIHECLDEADRAQSIENMLRSRSQDLMSSASKLAEVTCDSVFKSGDVFEIATVALTGSSNLQDETYLLKPQSFTGVKESSFTTEVESSTNSDTDRSDVKEEQESFEPSTWEITPGRLVKTPMQHNLGRVLQKTRSPQGSNIFSDDSDSLLSTIMKEMKQKEKITDKGSATSTNKRPNARYLKSRIPTLTDNDCCSPSILSPNIILQNEDLTDLSLQLPRSGQAGDSVIQRLDVTPEMCVRSITESVQESADYSCTDTPNRSPHGYENTSNVTSLQMSFSVSPVEALAGIEEFDSQGSFITVSPLTKKMPSESQTDTPTNDPFVLQSRSHDNLDIENITSHGQGKQMLDVPPHSEEAVKLSLSLRNQRKHRRHRAKMPLDCIGGMLCRVASYSSLEQYGCGENAPYNPDYLEPRIVMNKKLESSMINKECVKMPYTEDSESLNLSRSIWKPSHNEPVTSNTRFKSLSELTTINIDNPSRECEKEHDVFKGDNKINDVEDVPVKKLEKAECVPVVRRRINIDVNKPDFAVSGNSTPHSKEFKEPFINPYASIKKKKIRTASSITELKRSEYQRRNLYFRPGDQEVCDTDDGNVSQQIDIDEENPCFDSPAGSNAFNGKQMLEVPRSISVDSASLTHECVSFGGPGYTPGIGKQYREYRRYKSMGDAFLETEL